MTGRVLAFARSLARSYVFMPMRVLRQALANAQKEILFTKLMILVATVPSEELARDCACYESYQVPDDT